MDEKNKSVVWRVIWGVFLGIILLLFVRNVYFSYHYFEEGEVLVRDKDLPSAILHYRHSLESFVPFGGKNKDALVRLIELGNQAEKNRDLETALFAYRSARLGILSARHLWIPYKEELTYLHKKIAFLMSVQRSGQEGSPEKLRARYFSQLDSVSNQHPNSWFALLSGCALIGWLVSLFGVVRYGVDREGGIKKRGYGLVLASILLLALWLGGIWLS